jgi:beta-mannosidase
MSMDSDKESLPLSWRLLGTDPNQIQSLRPTHINSTSCRPVSVPGSIFEQFQEASEDRDWWYFCEFELNETELNSSFHLILERLATVCEIYVNEKLIATHANMFVPLRLDLSALLTSHNYLAICFRSLNEQLKQRKPRPRWKTNLVKNQQLRWFRTPLLGYIPGWTPATPAIGICGPAHLKKLNHPEITSLQLTTCLKNNTGSIIVKCQLDRPIDKLFLTFNDRTYRLNAEIGSLSYSVQASIDNPKRWWPHTHGETTLYSYELSVRNDSSEVRLAKGRCGFRSIVFLDDTAQTAFIVNGHPVFCRGACWTIQNIDRFHNSKQELEQLILQAKNANINMIRIGGTMEYESDAFYDLCDEHGIMVWQDFMFANMDYPFEDEAFRANVIGEADYQARRLLKHPSIAMLCGNSELAQQASMRGIDASNHTHDFFYQDLPAICKTIQPDINYVPTTPYGGALPFHISSGLTHFYGVGAYKMQLVESGAERVQFTPETLGFSHVPSAGEVDTLFKQHTPACHTPLWKKGIPRDSGAGWDFEDIRDYYLATLYKVDPIDLRSRDTLRYLELSRSVTGELINQTMALWRSSFSKCQGALLWFYKDIIPGAGWGLLTSNGTEKPAFYYAKRAFSPLCGNLIDRGLDGLYASLINDTDTERTVQLKLDLIATPNTIVDHYSQTLTLSARSSREDSIEALLGRFRDTSNRYQFGPKQYDVVLLQLTENQELVSQNCHFLESLDLPEIKHPNIELSYQNEGPEALSIVSDVFLHTVCLDAPGFTFSDNYFHLAPNTPRHIEVIPQQNGGKVLKGYLSAINIKDSVRIRFPRLAYELK